MKSLALALLIAAVVNVPAAEALFIPLSFQPGGTLQAGVPYTFRIQGNSGDNAVMLEAVVAAVRGRLDLGATSTVPAGNAVDLVFTIPSRASRVILVLDPIFPGFEGPVESVAGVVVLDQNGATVIVPMTLTDFTDYPHLEIVYEVVAPGRVSVGVGPGWGSSDGASSSRWS